MRRLHRLLTLFLIVAPSALVVGCSEVKLAYSFADTLIETQVIDRYLDLDSEGERVASAKVDEYLAWHRSKMLPRYAAFLKEQVRHQQNGWFDREWVRTSSVEAKILWDDTVRAAVGPVSAVLAKHTSPEQMAHLREQMKLRDEEVLARLSRPEAEQIKESVEQIVENFERFVGDLDDTQEALVERHARKLFNARGAQVWWRNRQMRQDAFLARMSAKPAAKDLEGFLGTLFLEPQKLSEPGYEKYQEAFRLATEDMLFEVLASLNQKQRGTLVDNLEGYVADFVDLSS